MTELDRETFETAIRSDKPALVDFWAGWCMPCKVFAPVLENVSDEMDGKVDFYKLNIDDYGDIAQKYDITSIPTVILFKNGEPAEQLIGVRSKDDVVQMIEDNL